MAPALPRGGWALGLLATVQEHLAHLAVETAAHADLGPLLSATERNRLTTQPSRKPAQSLKVGIHRSTVTPKPHHKVYALGTGARIRSVASGDHPYTEEDLRYARRRFLSEVRAWARATDLAGPDRGRLRPEIWDA